jgi:hypothetical protein
VYLYYSIVYLSRKDIIFNLNSIEIDPNIFLIIERDVYDGGS